MSSVLYDVPGPKARRLSRRLTWLAALLVAVGLGWIAYSLSQAGLLAPELWTALLNPNLVTLLAGGLLATIEVALLSMVLSLIFGALLAAGLLSGSNWLVGVLRGYVELFRGLPLLLLIFFIFLGGPAIGVDVPTFWSLVIGLVLYNTAVIAEIFRAGILSLPRGQIEAGLAIGLSEAEVFRIILLPQSIRRMLPALISQLVVVVKETSFGFIIGYTELLRDARTAVEFLGGSYSLPVYTLVAIIYIVINSLLSWVAERTQRIL
ncbi:amino acid ABC transporter permease [Ancylobacter mangrovi]|uniref:amino acid ABC transporter permease n=1 Tax=Ancylobacter mangrovi TaxID=2972472 RepID=UPI002163212C|nr:amino acid ABC transporter permease [Ancylobacter mangrovi]MCS0502057.1 amino acid ABC transporter permease [Ancylobacter mangrovi]